MPRIMAIYEPGTVNFVGSVNLGFVVQLVGFRRFWFNLGHVSGWFGSDLLVPNGTPMPNGVPVTHNRANS